MPRLHSRVPRPLAALLACVACLGLTWTLVFPAWQPPDETAHTAYVQRLAERGTLPETTGQYTSTEHRMAAAAANTYQVNGVPTTDPEWSPRIAERFARESKSFRRDDGGGSNPAASNPPLYYLYETVAYKLASSGDIFSRQVAMRLGSVAWLLVTVVAAWLLAGQIFGRDRRLQLVAASFTGLLPMMMAVCTSVNPDAMMIALWTLALWLGTATLRGAGWRTGAALGLVCGLALVTKPTSYALVLPVLIVLSIAAWRTRRERSTRAALKRFAAGVGALALPIGIWVIVARALNRAADSQLAATVGQNNIREFLTYVWQFYLPKLPFQSDYQATHPTFQTMFEGLPLYDTWIRTGGAAFGYLEVQFPEPVYWFFAAAAVATVVAFVLSLRGRFRQLDVAIGVFFVSLVFILLAGLHWTEYRLIQAGGQSFIQGRYLLPVAALGGLVVAQATRLVPAGRARFGTHAAVLASLVALQFFSLALVMARYFA